MKKLIKSARLSVIVGVSLLLFSTGSMAVTFGGDGGSNYNSNYNANSNINTNNNYNANKNINLNVTKISTTNKLQQSQGQAQSQRQSQFQGQSQNVKVGGQSTMQGNSQSVINEKEYLPTPNINPYITPLISNGRMGDFTTALPKLDGIKPLDKEKDVVVKVVGIFNGGVFTSIRLPEIEEELFAAIGKIKESGISMDKIRYQVWWLDAASSAGIGGGVAGGMSGSTDPITGAAAILPGYHVSTFNPAFILKFFEVK